MLKRKIAHIEEDVARIKKDNHRLIGELQRARNVRDLTNTFKSLMYYATSRIIVQALLF